VHFYKVVLLVDILFNFPPDFATYFPHFAQCFGCTLLLQRGMYGSTLSGKWWNQDLTNWLLSVRLVQSTQDPTYFVQTSPKNSIICPIFHVNNMLYFGNDDAAEQLFEQKIKGRFNVNILGQAHCFLLNLLQQFCCNNAPAGKPKLCDTPALPDYVFTVKNWPTTSADHAHIRKTYGA